MDRIDFIPLLGLLGPAVGFAFVILSIAVSPWFSFYDNALSDLGNAELHTSPSWVFNVGLVLSGLIVAVFASSLLMEDCSWKYSIWGIPLLTSALGLALIGVFPENSGRIHYVVSVFFFALITVSVLVYSYASWPLGRPRTGAVALLAGIVMAAVWLVEWPWPGVAIQESSTAAIAAGWLVTVAQGLRSRKPLHSRTENVA